MLKVNIDCRSNYRSMQELPLHVGDTLLSEDDSILVLVIQSVRLLVVPVKKPESFYFSVPANMGGILFKRVDVTLEVT